MILEAWASPPVLLCLNGLVVSFTGAPSAEHSAVLPDFAAEVDAFAAGIANNPLAFVPGKFFGRQFDLHPLGSEPVII
jgi:hypothetical protein